MYVVVNEKFTLYNKNTYYHNHINVHSTFNPQPQIASFRTQYVSTLLQNGSLDRILGFPIIINNTWALVKATFNLLGLEMNPMLWEMSFSIRPSVDRTVDKRIILHSWPWNSSTVPNFGISNSASVMRARICWIYKKNDTCLAISGYLFIITKNRPCFLRNCMSCICQYASSFHFSGFQKQCLGLRLLFLKREKCVFCIMNCSHVCTMLSHIWHLCSPKKSVIWRRKCSNT